MSTTIAVLRQQLQQLQALHDSGSLGADALAEARAPLERQLVALVMAGETAVTGAPAAPRPAAPRASRRLQGGLAAAVLVLAVGGYALTGSPKYAWLSPAQVGVAEAAAAASTDGGPPVTPEQINEMVQKLADRLKDKPDDAVGWTMLARAYSAMGRYGEAVPAFQKAVALAGDNASLLADYADALAGQNNGQLAGEPIKLVQRALALEPTNLKALALSGSAAFDERDYALAIRQWEQVERALPPDSNFVAQVRASIAKARELGGLPTPSATAAPATGVALSASSAASAAGTSSTAAATAGRATALSGTVSLAPALLAQTSPNDTVFILARAANGPRMPLAVLRKQVKDLPLTFTLDDGMAMAPTAKISDHAQVIVVARVSKSGNAITQPGDLSGQSAPVAPGTGGIAVEIRDVADK